MFNLSGSEMVFLLLLALIILGPEKLPEAVRRFGKGYSEFKKMSMGFQSELKSALDEPMREMRETADALLAGITGTTADLVPAFTVPLPNRVTVRMLGFDPAEQVLGLGVPGPAQVRRQRPEGSRPGR